MLVINRDYVSLRGSPSLIQALLALRPDGLSASATVATADFVPWFGLPSGLRMVELESGLSEFVRDRYVLEGEVSPGFLAVPRR